jgi:hypothetical protein
MGCRKRQGILGRIKELADSEDDMVDLLFVVKIYAKHFDIAAPIRCCNHCSPGVKALEVSVSAAAAREANHDTAVRARHYPSGQ